MDFSKPADTVLSRTLISLDKENQTHNITDNLRNKSHHGLSNGVQLRNNQSSKMFGEFDETYLATGSTLFIENVPNYVKAIFGCVCIISLMISSFSLTVLKRTKRIPYAAKFLSTGLLCFDSLYITSITVRKFIQDPLYNTSINVLSTTVLQLAYVTVGLMSLERFLMFYKPMRYMAKCTESFLRTVATILWISTVVIFQSVRYGVCYGKFKSPLVFVQAGQCNQIVTFYYAALVVLVLCVSMSCYLGIFNIVKAQLADIEKKKSSFASTANLLRSYKSTSLVLVYLLVIFVTSVTYALIIVYIRYTNLEVPKVRISLEIISTINCILDPFLYVMWFKESRMEVLKLLSRFNKKFEKKAEMMKYEIFYIVTASLESRSSTIDGH